MVEYTKNISMEHEGHTFINDVERKQIRIQGVGNENIIPSCILSIDGEEVTVQTGRTVETVNREALPPALWLMVDLLLTNAPKGTGKSKPKKTSTKKTSTKKTSTKKTSTKKTTQKGTKEK